MDAKQALDKMNGYELAGRNLRVGLVNEKTGTAGNYSLDEEGMFKFHKPVNKIYIFSKPSLDRNVWHFIEFYVQS
jgi:DNA-binding transcriptional regulator PaaX